MWNDYRRPVLRTLRSTDCLLPVRQAQERSGWALAAQFAVLLLQNWFYCLLQGLRNESCLGC